MTLFRDVRVAAANPEQTDFVQLQAWVRARTLSGDQWAGEEFAWAKRGWPVRTAEWARQIVRGRATPMERANRRYDILTVEAMRRVLNPDSTCIDIGAATGEILKFMQVLAPNGNIHAVEPIPFQAAELRLRFPDVTVHEVALSDEAGVVDFYVVRDDPCISALRDPQEIRRLAGDTRISDWQGQVNTLSVTTTRLDDLLDGNESIDFIKMDVEGAELSVFRGALRTLAESRPIVVFEYSGARVNELFGATNLIDTLSEVGFRVSSLEGWIAGRPPDFPAPGTWMYVAHPSG